MLWHQVKNEGREQSGHHVAPSQKDDFLERTKDAREERQLEKIRGKIKGWEQSGRHVVAPGKK
jgi:hypothetical protein